MFARLLCVLVLPCAFAVTAVSQEKQVPRAAEIEAEIAKLEARLALLKAELAKIKGRRIDPAAIEAARANPLNLAQLEVGQMGRLDAPTNAAPAKTDFVERYYRIARVIGENEIGLVTTRGELYDFSNNLANGNLCRRMRIDLWRVRRGKSQ